MDSVDKLLDTRVAGMREKVDMETGEVFTEPTWMVNGVPGQILSLMARAAQKTGIVPLKRGARSVGDHYDIGSMERAARVWFELGLMTTMVTDTAWVGQGFRSSDDKPMQFPAQIYVTLTVIAPDGSYLQARALGAATATGGRHFSQATTAGRKACLRVLLGVASEENDQVEAARQAAETARKEEEAAKAAEARGAWSDNLRSVVAAIDACANSDELAQVGKHELMSQLTQEEREVARAEWRRHNEELLRMRARWSGR